jgi:hypothetical protein
MGGRRDERVNVWGLDREDSVDGCSGDERGF